MWSSTARSTLAEVKLLPQSRRQNLSPIAASSFRLCFLFIDVFHLKLTQRPHSISSLSHNDLAEK
jgi:hypothetical protein